MSEACGPADRDRFFHLRVGADLSELAKARRFLEEVGGVAELSDDRLFNLQVAVSEAVANAIEHAESEVELTAWVLPDRVMVEIANEGAFQPGLYKDDKHRRRGLGLPLMVSLADQVHVSRVTGGRTQVSLTFFLEGYRDRNPDASALSDLSGAVGPVERASAAAIGLQQEIRASQFSQATASSARDSTAREVEDRYQGLVDLSPDAILVEVGGKYVFANPAAARLLGARSPVELIGKYVTAYIDPDDRELISERMGQVLAGAVTPPREIRLRRIDGSPVDVEATASRIAFDGRLAVQVILRDITDRKQAEEALRRSEESVRRKLDSLLSPEGDIGELRLADIIDSAALQSFLEDFHELARIPLAIIDLEGKVLVGAGWSDICMEFHRVHPDACRNCIESDTVLTTGVQEGEFRLYKCKNHMWDVATPITVGGKHLGNVFAGQFFFEDEPVDRELFRSQARKYGFDEETYLEALDSVPRLSREVIARGMGFFTKLAAMLSKESYGSINLARSVTERDALLESLRESEERFRMMFERHNAVMLLIDPKTGSIEDCNMAASRFYGYSRDDLRALCIHDLNQLPAEEVTAEYGKAAAEERNHFEFPHRAAGGETRWVDVHSAPIEAQGKPLLFSVIHDITERKLAEAERERLREIEQELTEELQAQNEELAVQGEELQVQNEELRAAQSESARLLKEQSSLLFRLQEVLLDIPQELPGVKFGHLYRSATREALVGGDFYDVFGALDGRIGLLIGDVCGHGVEAARIATLVKDTVHAFAHQFRDPHLVLSEANRLLVEKNRPGFVTAFLGFLDAESGTFTYSSAGHPPPLLAREGQVTPLQSIGSPLGVFVDARYWDSETVIQEGSLLLFYTDGITEARRDSDLFGEERLAEALGRMGDRALETLPSLLLDEALLFSGGRLEDDAAMLAVEYVGRRSRGAQA